MVKKSFKIFIICLILLMTVGMVSAAEDADDSNSTDTLSVSEDIKTDDILEVSEDEDVLGDEVGSFSELQTEIDNAAEGSVIYLEKDYKRNSYSQSGMTINKQLTIDGKGHSLDGESSGRIFNIYSGNVILKNITFKNAKPGSGSGGAVYASSDMITIDSCNFEYNTVSDTSSATGNYKQEFGGSIYLDGNNNCIKNCNFTNKNWDDVTSSNVTLCNVLEGGEIYLNGANNLIEACHFLNSYAWESGGAIYCNGNNNTISGSEFINSTVTSYALHRYYNSGRYYYYDSGEGGAVFFKGNDNKVLNSNFTGFFTFNEGMCLYFYGSDNLVNNSRFEDTNYDLPNSCSKYNVYCYSALYFLKSNNLVVNSNFTRIDSTHNLYFHNEYNTVDNCIFNDSIKGCIYSYKDNILINNSKFLNSKSGYCVGLNGVNTNCVIDNSLFDNNSGYGKLAVYGRNINIYNCNFTNNKAEDSGIISVSESMLYNCKFINNSANTFGGAIISEGGITIDSCDFDNNSAVGGGAIYVWGNDCRIYNSNFANNKAYNARDIDNFNPTGGAVFISGNGIVIENITCINNSAVAGDNGISNGGAIAVVVCNNVNIHNVNFTNNSAYKGGAIYQLCCDADISNCNFINDSATYGSEIYLNNVANTISIESDTETDNTNLIFSEEFTGENNCVLENSTIFLVKSNIEIKLGLNEKLNIVGQLTFKDESIKGVYVNQSTFEYNNISYNDSGKIISADCAFANQSVNVEIYDDNDELIVSGTYKTDDNGVFEIDAYDLVSRGTIKYTKAYRLEDNSYFYGENNYNIPQLGDFTILQSLINQVEENGTLVLDRNYTYDLISDTITEGLVIIKNNITIDCNGYTINAQNQSRIFKVIGDNAKLININAINPKEINGTLVYIDNARNATIENTNLNIASSKTSIYVNGGDLTINNCEFNFTNGVDAIKEFNGNNYTITSYNGYCGIEVNTTGNFVISKSKFKNAKFNSKIIYVENAGNFTLDDVEFSNNLGYNEYYDLGDDGKVYVSGYELGMDGSLVYANALNVNILNVLFTNNTVDKFAELETDNLIIKNLTASDSYVKNLFNVEFNNTADVDGLTVNNVNYCAYIYNWDSDLKDYTPFINAFGDQLISICSDFSYNETTNVHNYYNEYLSFKNAKFKSTQMGYENLLDLGGNNVIFENISFSDIKMSQIEGSYYEGRFMGINESMGMLMSITGDNMTISNTYFDNIEYCDGRLIYAVNQDNTDLSNVYVSNMKIGQGEALIEIDSNSKFSKDNIINISNLTVTNITSGYNMTEYYSGEEMWEYEREMGVETLYVNDEYATVNINDIYITDSMISNSLMVQANNTKVQNIRIINCSLLEAESLIEISALNNVAVENILIDNLDVIEELTFYWEDGRYEMSSLEIETSSPSITISSERGNVYLNDINLTNSVSMPYEGLINVYAQKNITVSNLNLENISGTVQSYAEWSNELQMWMYENVTGEFNNGLSFKSDNGTIDISNLNADNVESHGKKFFDVTGTDITLADISFVNTTTNGKEGSILLNATCNLTISNFILDNYSISNGRSETSYHDSHHRYVNEYESWGWKSNSDISILIIAKNADIDDMNLTNIVMGGVSHYDDLTTLLNIHVLNNLTADNILIENVTSSFNSTSYYNETLKRNIYKNTSSFVSGGMSVDAGNATVSNIVINNIIAREGEIFTAVAIDNLELYNITITNVYSTGSEARIEISVDNGNGTGNLTVDKFTFSNVTSDIALSGAYYDPVYQKYINTYDSNAEEGGLYVSMNAANANVSNVDLVNVEGGYFDGFFIITSENLTLNNVLIDNITPPTGCALDYDEQYDMYVYSNNTGMSSGGLVINSNESSISNININDITANYYAPGFKVVGNNTKIENLNISNVEYIGRSDTIYEVGYDKYITSSFEKTNNMILVTMSDTININNMTADNIAGAYETIQFNGKNVIIANSSFSNINTTFDYYDYDAEYSHDYIVMEHSNEGHGVYVKGDNIQITNTGFENMSVGADEYALYVYSGNSTLIDNCTFSNINSSYDCYGLEKFYPLKYEYYEGSSDGGAVYIYGGNYKNIKDSTFTNCSADMGGAIYVDSPLNITGSKFINNTGKLGGAIYVWGNGLNINDTYFEGNRAVDGGAIYFAISAYNNTVYNSTFSKNFAEHNGGALYIYETTHEGVNIINASTFLDNHANYNGGAYFFNDTINNMVWDDYRWDNATASTETHGAYTFISPNLHRTMIILSEFERNSDYSLNITAHNNAVGGNHTVTITIDEIAEGYIYVNITDKDGNYVKDKNGNEINGRYLLEDGKLLLELEDLEIGQYNVSAYYDGWDYELYPLYYHVNSTVFEVYPHDLNVTVTKSAYADENITVTAKLNNKTTGTVNITVSNGTFTKTYSDIPVVNGTVVYNVTGFYAGDYNITVTYNGDDIFYSKSNTTNFTVKQRKSVIDSVEVEDNVYGTTTKIIVKVPENQTGNVTVKINGENITKEVTDGEVTFEIENLTATEWEAEITFKENRVYDENSTAFRFNVTKADLTCEVEAANVTVKDNGSFTITVPEDFKGNVTIKIKGTEYYNGPVSDIVNITALPAGNYTADVTFCGDKNYNDTTIKADFTVESVEPEMTVEITSHVYGNNATATITVANMANGTVNITVDGKIYTGEVKNGTATVQLDNVSAGVKTAEAKFITADLYNSNTTAAATFTVTKANATLTITNHTRDVVINLPQDANGSVEIYVNGEKYIKEIKNGKATVENILKDGENSVVAIWVGDDNYNDASNSTRIGFDKDAGKKNATLTISNESRDVIVELPADAKGNLTVYINGDKYTPEIVNGKANISGKLIDGNNSVVAIWSGDTNYTSAVNSTKINIEKVTPPKTLPEIAISADDRDVIISLPENAEGNLTVYINGEKYTPEIQNGKANVTGILKDGNNTVVVIYSGDANYTDGVNATSIYIESPIKQNATIKITNQTADIVITFPEGASGNVTVYVNGKNYTAEIINGNATVKDVLVDGNNSVVVVWDGDDKYNRLSNSTVIELPVNEIPSKLFNITVTDLIAEGGKVIVNVTGEGEGSVNVTVDNGTVQSKALTNGEAVFDLTGLSTDRHEIVVTTPDGAVSKITIDAKANGGIEIATIKAENMTRGYGSPYDYQAAFLDAEGNALVNTVVTFKVNGKEYNATTNSDGIAQLTDAKLAVGKYNITSINTVTGESITRELEIVKRILENKDMTMDYTDGSVFKVKVIGDDGNIAPEGSIISITANGVSYVAKVDSKGYASLKINLLPKTYKVVCEFNGYKTTNKLVVKQILKPVKKTIKVKKSKKSFKIKATLKWSNKKPIKGKKITFKIKGKTLKAKTNKKGVATVKVKKSLMKKLKKGKTYTVKITYAVKVKYGDAYQTISDTVKCKVKVK